jgi:hypothetical protein
VLVHHATAHSDRERHHALEHARAFESADAAGRESEVDRPAGVVVGATRIGAAFVDGDVESAPGEQDRE